MERRDILDEELVDDSEEKKSKTAWRTRTTPRPQIV